jgi:hypothetical protein
MNCFPRSESGFFVVSSLGGTRPVPERKALDLEEGPVLVERRDEGGGSAEFEA